MLKIEMNSRRWDTRPLYPPREVNGNRAWTALAAPAKFEDGALPWSELAQTAPRQVKVRNRAAQRHGSRPAAAIGRCSAAEPPDGPHPTNRSEPVGVPSVLKCAVPQRTLHAGWLASRAVCE